MKVIVVMVPIDGGDCLRGVFYSKGQAVVYLNRCNDASDTQEELEEMGFVFHEVVLKEEE